jgi:hypothetical protein
MDFTAAREFLEKRLDMPTDMASRVISDEIPARVRAHCFFSARVAEGHVLAKLRGLSDAYANGEIDLATARMKFKEWHDREKPGKRHADGERITNIASTMRLDLVFRQNAAMAAGVGRYQVGRDPDVEERWPCWRYITGPNPRDAHLALDGRVFLKSDPVWHRIYPPWEFNCNCDVEDAELPEKGADRIDADAVPKSESGFAFDPAEAFMRFDPDLIPDPDLREQTVSEMAVFLDDLELFGKDNSGKKPKISWKDRKEVKEAEKKMRKFGKTVRLDGLTGPQAREISNTLEAISKKYRLEKLDKIVTVPGDDPTKPATTSQDPNNPKKITITFNLIGVANLGRVREYPPELRQEVMDGKTGGNPDRERKKFHVRHNVGARRDEGYSMVDVTRHEAAHAIVMQLEPGKRRDVYAVAEQLQIEYIENANRKISLYRERRGVPRPELPEEVRKELGKPDITMLSRYAEFSPSEFIAEAFVAKEKGEQALPEPLLRLLDKLPQAKKGE